MELMTYDPRDEYVGRLRCGRCGWTHFPSTGADATKSLRRHARACPAGAHPVGREYIFNEHVDCPVELWRRIRALGLADPVEWFAALQTESGENGWDAIEDVVATKERDVHD